MPGPTSITQVDLTPLPGKTYFSIDREWREEFIYFLMVDRFQDDSPRTPVLQPQRSKGVHAPDNAFYGGAIKGINPQSRLHRRIRLHRDLAFTGV